MAKHRTGRDRGPFFRQAHLLKPESGEAAAARALQVEQDRRAGECLAEILAALDRHRCTFQVVVQDLMTPGQGAADRRCQVNVVPLNTPAAPAPSAELGGSAGNGSKPAP